MINDIKAFMPPDVGVDEHVVRRLGWAVIRQWDRLPSALQERIQTQAVFVDGADVERHLRRGAFDDRWERDSAAEQLCPQYERGEARAWFVTTLS
jgi:hypothetical protein